MSSTGRTSPTSSAALPPRPGLPGWAIAVIALLTVIAVAAVVIAVIAVARDDTPASGPTPASSAPAVTASGSPSSGPAGSSPSSAVSTGPALADGCLGGPTELDQAVMTAQKQSALTRTGAATFVASLARWAFAGPPPPFQKDTAKQILAPDATAAAKHWLSSSRDLKGSTGTLDFTDGKYYVEAFAPTSAVVSYVGTGHVADNGVAQPDVRLAATVHLRSVNGVWRLADKTNERAVDDVQRIGTAYTGGC
jgi:hypothetical protein